MCWPNAEHPLQALIEAGYPPDRLKLILIDREPLTSLASWLAIFSSARRQMC